MTKGKGRIMRDNQILEHPYTKVDRDFNSFLYFYYDFGDKKY